MSAIEGDPAVDPEFDSFSLVLPLPYRVAIIIVFGVWAWGLNLHYLSLIRIDVPALIRYPSRTSPTHTPHHTSCYHFASLLSLPLTISIVLFWLLTRAKPALVLQWELLPNLSLLMLILAFVLPSRFSQKGRYRFLRILGRVSIGGLAEPGDGKFGDILMADVLTSYAKVLGDLFVALCMAFNGKHSTAKPDRSCGGQFIVPILISIPSFIRLRQCLTEYVRVRRSMKVGVGTVAGWGGQHLANALKYSSAFPVIVLSAWQRYDPSLLGVSEVGLSRLWLIAVFFNSFYSFYWDVTKDWDLTLLSPSKRLRSPSPDPTTKRPEYPYGLRRHRYFHTPNVYYTVIFLDLVLRCTWSFKLSPHLHQVDSFEGGIFVLELLEVFRRWVWIFFRVETEWVRNNTGPAQDDVLLGEFGEYTGKYDDD